MKVYFALRFIIPLVALSIILFLSNPTVSSAPSAITTTTYYTQSGSGGGFGIYFGNYLGGATAEFAADFTVPTGETWTITHVQFFLQEIFPLITGVDVAIASNNAGIPGTDVCFYGDIAYTTVSTFYQEAALPSPCLLTAGTYWFSATPNLSCTYDPASCIAGISTYGGTSGFEGLIFASPGVCTGWTPIGSCFGVVAQEFQFAVLNISNDSLVANAACNGDNLDVTITSGDGPFLINATGSSAPSEPTTVTATGTHSLQGPDRWIDLTLTEQGGDGETTSLGTYTCANLNGSILIPAGAPSASNGSAGPYPSTTTISGLPSVITDVNLSIIGLGHSYPADVEILLVSPAGTGMVVMADMCNDYGGSVYNFTFDDEAPAALPNANGCVSGTYQRSVTTTPTFSSPAPAGPYITNFAGFDGEDPNGTWSLYVRDDSAFDLGDIESWSLDITASYIDLAATAVCNGNNLEVAISAGDGMYNITGSGPGLPANGVTSGQVLNGPAVWTGVTVTEAGGDSESLGLGDFSCTTDTPGLSLSSANPFEVSEAGSTNTTYFVALNTAPTTSVTVDLSVDAQCTISATQFVFDASNWNTNQAVTVTAVDDAVAEGTHSCVVSHSTTSTFATYDGLSEDLTFTVFDDDVIGIIITPNGFIVLEIGQPVYTYTVRLSSSPASGETVTVNIPANAQLFSLSPNLLTFDETNWNTPQTVSLQALEDGIAEGITTEYLTHSASSSLGGSIWNGVAADLVIYIYDDEESAPFEVPNLGEIMITTDQVQQPYDGPGGQPIYLPTGGELFLPADYDGNGFDTYTITEITTIGDVTWYGVFIGNRYWVWLPETNVTRVR